MYCKNCGKQIPDDAKFCQNCGANQTEKTETPVSFKRYESPVEKFVKWFTAISFAIILIVLILAIKESHG